MKCSGQSGFLATSPIVRLFVHAFITRIIMKGMRCASHFIVPKDEVSCLEPPLTNSSGISNPSSNKRFDAGSPDAIFSSWTPASSKASPICSFSIETVGRFWKLSEASRRSVNQTKNGMLMNSTRCPSQLSSTH